MLAYLLRVAGSILGKDFFFWFVMVTFSASHKVMEYLSISVLSSFNVSRPDKVYVKLINRHNEFMVFSGVQKSTANRKRLGKTFPGRFRIGFLATLFVFKPKICPGKQPAVKYMYVKISEPLKVISKNARLKGEGREVVDNCIRLYIHFLYHGCTSYLDD